MEGREWDKGMGVGEVMGRGGGNGARMRERVG